MRASGKVGRVRIATVMAWSLLIAPCLALANGPEVGIEGGALFPIESRDVQLVREEVVLDLRDPDDDGPDGSAHCVYVLRNLSSRPVDIAMGFLLNEPISPESQESWNELYRMAELSVTQDGRPRAVTYRPQRRGEFRQWYWAAPDSVPSWTLRFAPRGESRVEIRYRVEWSGGCDGFDCGQRMRYFTRPAALWAGMLESARFELRLGDSGLVRRLQRAQATGRVRVQPARHRWTDTGVLWEFQAWEPDSDLVFGVEWNWLDPSRDPRAHDSLAVMPALTRGLDSPIVVVDSMSTAWVDPREGMSFNGWPEIRVRVRVEVGVDGVVTSARLPDPPMDLEEESLSRARSWRFSVPRRRGRPVSAWTDVVIVWPARPRPTSTLGR